MKLKNPPVRVHHQQLSLWQSVVKETAIKMFSDDPEFIQKIIDANDAFVKKAAENPGHPMSAPLVCAADYPAGSTTPFKELSKENLAAFFERQYVDLYMTGQKATKMAVTSNADDDEYRPFSDDPKSTWVKECSGAYFDAFTEYGGVRAYNSYPENQKSTYGVINWQIPQGSRVAIIGDWGTGEEDAKYLFKDMIQQHSPACIIHLGDVYYAGRTSETSSNFTNVINAVFTELGVNIPVFTIPGNHEYYSLGYPYFAALPGLNRSLGSQYLQQASYFCLRVAGCDWQFLAMDTGYNDSDPSDEFDPASEGPHLRSSEREWHKDKLDSNNFTGTTILLSHHQLFSANAKINGMFSWDGIWHSEYLNMGLLNTFQKYFKDRIACWIWGHEHNFAAYQNNLEGLAKGRLLGCSAYEEETASNPYTVNCDDYPYYTDNSHPNGYQVSNANGYYNHAYCILDFSNCNSANDSVSANYYEYPSWGGSTPKPSNPVSTPLFSESISRPVSIPAPVVNYNDVVKFGCIKNGGQMFLAGADASYNAKLENYIENFQIQPANGNANDIEDSDLVYLVNISPVLNGYKYLSTNGSSAVCYLDSPTDESKWQIKIDNGNSGTSICRGDSIHFKSNAHSSYYLNVNNHNMLVLNNSAYLSLTINPGASVPTSEPFPSGRAVRLAVAYQNEWYYNAQSRFYESSVPYSASVISMHDIVVSGGAGPVPLQLLNKTNNGVASHTLGTVTYNTARILQSGDSVDFASISGTGAGVDGGLFLKGMGSANPMSYFDSEPIGEYIVRKANGETGYIMQNELLYIESTSFPNHYVSVVNISGVLYLGLSFTPVFCRLDYQEID